MPTNHAVRAVDRPVILTRRSSFGHWARDQVRWSDTDLIGHANHLSVAGYCETGRTLLLRELLGRDNPERIVLLAAQLIVNYLGESHWPTPIEIGSGVLSIGNSSCRIGQGVFDGDRCIASAETTLVLIDDGHKPRAIPPWLRDWMQQRAIIAG